MIKFISQNNCEACNTNSIPLAARSILLTEDNLICGYCGAKIKDTQSLDDQHNFAAASMTLSLICNGLFHMDPQSTYNPLTLTGGDSTGMYKLTCKIGTSTALSNSSQVEQYRPFRAKDINCVLPDTVLKAAQRIARLKIDDDRPSFKMADVSGERKVLRFELVNEAFLEFNPNWRYQSATTRIEISWSEPKKIDAEVFLPIFGTAEAVRLLNGLPKGDTYVEHAQLCFNRYTGEQAVLAQYEGRCREAYLLRIDCDPYAIARALIEDGELIVGKSGRHLNKVEWWQDVSRNTEWSDFGVAVCNYLRTLHPRAFSLVAVPLP